MICLFRCFLRRCFALLYTGMGLAENWLMPRRFILTLVFFACFAVPSYAQQPELKEPAKINTRPAATTAAEPFDKADVKTMSGQCVSLDTEAGIIEMEMYPEHAPESVRNF